jgi:hypothetical protein
MRTGTERYELDNYRSVGNCGNCGNCDYIVRDIIDKKVPIICGLDNFITNKNCVCDKHKHSDENNNYEDKIMETYSMERNCTEPHLGEINVDREMDLIEVFIDRHERKARMIFKCGTCGHKEEYECRVGLGDHEPYLTLL